MSAQHTPGPWQVDDFPLDTGIASQGLARGEWVGVLEPCDEDGNAYHIAYCHPDNARLIAIAPELLAAIRGVMNPLNPIDDDGHDIALRLTREQWDAARAAIAKAENAA
jgi:hypothetical protein